MHSNKRHHQILGHTTLHLKVVKVLACVEFVIDLLSIPVAK